jgi:IS605 OrfB family transposase
MQLTTSYKLKLNPNVSQETFLISYFNRFSKAVNFFANKIQEVEREQQAIYEFIKKKNIQGLDGQCSYCKKAYYICSKHKLEGKNRNDRNKICKACDQRSLIVRRKKDGTELVCGKCWNKEFSIRKILYATNKRKRSKYGDVRDAVALPGTEYALAFKRANDTLKAYGKQRNKVKFTIYKTTKQKDEWQEVLENKNITLELLKEWSDRYKTNEKVLNVITDLRKSTEKQSITARFTMPHQEKQRTDRYKHILFKDNLSQGKTENTIKKTITALDKTLEKLDKRLKETQVFFKGAIVDLQDTAMKNIGEKFVELTIDGRKEQFTLDIDTVQSKKGKIWLKSILVKINKGELKYPLLIWDKSKNNFYLSYPLTQEIEKPKIPDNAKVMGIDRGVNQIAVCAILDKLDGTPHDIVFYSGKKLMKEKIKYQLIRKKMTGTKSVNKRRSKFGKKVSRVSSLLLHEISKKIIQQAFASKPVVIVMENLDMIQGAKRIKKTKAVQERKINFLLSNFTYGQLQKLVEYKALQKRLPILYVPPEYTSQVCYKCGKTGYRNKGFFKCTNNDCNERINADLNGAINIAKSGFEKIDIV